MKKYKEKNLFENESFMTMKMKFKKLKLKRFILHFFLILINKVVYGLSYFSTMSLSDYIKFFFNVMLCNSHFNTPILYNLKIDIFILVILHIFLFVFNIPFIIFFYYQCGSASTITTNIKYSIKILGSILIFILFSFFFLSIYPLNKN